MTKQKYKEVNYCDYIYLNEHDEYIYLSEFTVR